jgi:ribosomal protein S18 acetylase RimI-like enzyme
MVPRDRAARFLTHAVAFPVTPADSIRNVNIVELGPDDASKVFAAAGLFDHQPKMDATARFLGEPGHHLLFAYDGSVPVGFISGVETVHPDKGTEMFLYELGVAESHRRRGVGRALVERLSEIARSVGCYGMWVATDDANVAALATYEGSGAKRDEKPAVILTWTLAT